MFTTHFYGQEISNYGRENGRVDYRTLARCFDAVLCNGILGYRDGFEDWEQIGGYIDNSETLEELRKELEEAETELEELKTERTNAESNFEDLERASENIGEILDRFDNFEYYANELEEAIKWNDCETPHGDDLDAGTVQYSLDELDLYGMREAIETHSDTVREQYEGTEERLEELGTQIEELGKKCESLNDEIETLEAEEDEPQEVFQWYIISDNGADILKEWLPSEVLYYNEELDLYVWGVTHWGTSWDYVLTSIPCESLDQERARLEAEEKAEEISTEPSEDELEELLDLWDNGFATVGEPTEIEEEPTEDPLELWEQKEAENIDNAVVEAVAEELENTAQGENLSREEALEPIGWETVIEGDIVIAKWEASQYYGCTIEGWKGVVTMVFFNEGEDEPYAFHAKTIEGGKCTYEGEEFWNLEPHFFDLYKGEEGGER